MKARALLFALPISAGLAASARAETQVPAPDYFVTTVMETSTAQQLAVSCPKVSVHLGRMSERTEAVLLRLSEDGFTPENLETRMADPSEAIAALQSRFMAKHALQDGAPQQAVCAAGLAEITEGTGIGRLLIEESP